jgi:hypothetical protein
VGLRGPIHRQIGGFDALQYEVDASGARQPLVYLHTTIAGRRGFHQVLCWSPRDAYDRTAFERLLDAFEEPVAPIGSRPARPVYSGQASAYDVH